MIQILIPTLLRPSSARSILVAGVLSLITLQVFAAPLRLALNWKPEPQFGGFYAAREAFLKEKLQVEILPGGSGTPTLQMLAAGRAEYAVVSADEIILGHDRGITDVVALFAAYQTNPQAIMTRQEKNYASLEQVLNDHKATLLWQNGLPYALFLTQKYGRPKSQTAPYSGGIGAFLQSPNINQQCFITSEPLAAEKAGLKVKSFLVADAGYNPYTTVLVTRRERLQKNKAEVEALVRAVRAGWEAYLKDPETTNRDLNRLNPAMDLATMNRSAQAQKPLIETPWTLKAGLGKMQNERWLSLIEQLASLKLIRTKPAAERLFRAD